VKIFLSVVALAIAAILGWVGLHLAPLAGWYSELAPVLVDQCRRVDIAPGTEDIEIDEETGQVFISTFDRRGWYAGDADDHPAGAIYLLDLNDRTLTPRKISDGAPRDFSPHGISLWRGADGLRRLFVVNHRKDGTEAVEFFNVDDRGVLYHMQTVSFGYMYSPNDIAAVGPRQFYATNDRRHDTGLKALLESYLALPLTDVVYYDGFEGHVAARGLAYANGIAPSADGSEIYVAEILKRRVNVYARNTQSGALKLRQRYGAGTAPDNIDVAPDGMLYAGGHPKIFEFMAHAKDPGMPAPSHVVRIDPKTGVREDVFISINGEISGSSVGAASEDTLIIGAVFDGHIMVCPLSD
jgi:arylesterase/paraoxonase